MRKKLLCRNLTYAQQVQYIQNVNERTHAGYEEELTAIDIATIVLAHHVLTGERYLGDFTGAESHPTYSCCKDSVKCDERVYPLIIGNFAIDNLNINRRRESGSSDRSGVTCTTKVLFMG